MLRQKIYCWARDAALSVTNKVVEGDSSVSEIKVCSAAERNTLVVCILLGFLAAPTWISILECVLFKNLVPQIY